MERGLETIPTNPHFLLIRKGWSTKMVWLTNLLNQ